jgi:hypothetical protein
MCICRGFGGITNTETYLKEPHPLGRMHIVQDPIPRHGGIRALVEHRHHLVFLRENVAVQRLCGARRNARVVVTVSVAHDRDAQVKGIGHVVQHTTVVAFIGLPSIPRLRRRTDLTHAHVLQVKHSNSDKSTQTSVQNQSKINSKHTSLMSRHMLK